jgi:hypothetical protein
MSSKGGFFFLPKVPLVNISARAYEQQRRFFLLVGN